jgi:hypothetical protein
MSLESHFEIRYLYTSSGDTRAVVGVLRKPVFLPTWCIHVVKVIFRFVVKLLEGPVTFFEVYVQQVFMPSPWAKGSQARVSIFHFSKVYGLTFRTRTWAFCMEYVRLRERNHKHFEGLAVA